jgi:hypothetical protein
MGQGTHGPWDPLGQGSLTGCPTHFSGWLHKLSLPDLATLLLKADPHFPTLFTSQQAPFSFLNSFLFLSLLSLLSPLLEGGGGGDGGIDWVHFF